MKLQKTPPPIPLKFLFSTFVSPSGDKSLRLPVTIETDVPAGLREKLLAACEGYKKSFQRDGEWEIVGIVTLVTDKGVIPLF